MTRPLPRFLVVAASAAAIVALMGAPAGADPAWTPAVALPGLSVLNTTGAATADDLSCTSAGNCGLVGTYSDSLRHVQAFVANEVNFVWGSAQSIPGLIALNVGGKIYAPVISCTSATSCTVAGTYTDSQGFNYGFTDDETGGTWGTAAILPLSSQLPTGAQSIINDVACTSPGTCVATGGYLDVSGIQSLVATETSGTWAGAVEVPGSGQLNAGGLGAGTWATCPAAGSCVVGGQYTDASKNVQVWVASESSGTWQSAAALPGLVALNVGGDAVVGGLSCSSVGNCAIGGLYSLSTTQAEPFVASEVSGTWASAEEVPGSLNLNTGQVGAVSSVACPADGQCQAVGFYVDNAGGLQNFVVSEVGGVWQDMAEIPGTAALNATGKATTPWVSCVSTGDCRTVGGYGDPANAIQAYDATQTGGTWGNAEETPGTPALNVQGNGSWDEVSCTTDGGCGAAGTYKDSSGYIQVMVMTTASPPKNTVPGAPREHLASPSKGVVTISITPPASNGGSAITGYQYSVNGGAWKSTSSTHVTLRHLKVGSKVRVRVRAVNAVGTGPASGTATIKVK